jgi:NADH-quinone oxidoreductase subunit M
MDSLPLLSLLTFLPAAVGLGLTLLPSSLERSARGIALAATLAEVGLAVVLWTSFTGDPGLQFVETVEWIPRFAIQYHVGIDGLALCMIALTALLMPMTVLTSWDAITHRPKGFYASLLFLQAGMMGVFAAADLFLFYVYWEVMLIPMALLIGVWGGQRRIYASIKFVLYTMVGSLLMLVAMLYVYTQLAEPTFEIARLQLMTAKMFPVEVQIPLFLAFALAFAIKVPMFPFHTWLPDAHVEAPTAGSVILAGVLLKMGSYGFLRLAIPFFPAAAVAVAPVILVLSVVGIVFGSLMSLAQKDIKKLIAYSSVAHLGFVMVGLFSMNVAAAQGGFLQSINHGISTGALFLLVGVIYERTHTRGVNDFGGLAPKMPVYGTLFMIVMLSSIGLPGTNGFVGEFLVLLGTFQVWPFMSVGAALGVVLGAVYMLKLYRNVFYGPANPAWGDLPDTNAKELAALVPLVILIFLLGLFPNTLLEVSEGPVADVVRKMNDARTASAEAAAPASGAVPARALGGE